MRVVIFSGHSRERVTPWAEAIERVPSVSDVLVVGPRDADFLARSTERVAKSAGVLARIRSWAPDLGVAIAAPNLPELASFVPRLGTLEVRLGDGSQTPGLYELAHGVEHADVAVQWRGAETRCVGMSGRVPVYAEDTVAAVRDRLDELGRLLLPEAVARVSSGGAPGVDEIKQSCRRTPASFWRRWKWRRRIALRRLRLRLTPRLTIKTLIIGAWLVFVRPLRDAMRTLFGRHPVRIFTLHRVSSLRRDGLTVPPDVFRRQMEFIARHHDVADLDRAVSLVARGARLRRPVAAVTFDDGYESVAMNAAPVMNDLGIVGACFVCPEVVRTDGHFEHDGDVASDDFLNVMDWHTIRSLQQDGWHVGSHTSTHARVSTLDDEGLRRELWDSRAALRDAVAEAPMAFAYPFGAPADVTPEAVRAARKCGYIAVLGDYGGENLPGSTDEFFLHRIDIGGAHDTLMWKAMVHGFDFRFWRRVLGARPNSG